MSNHLKLDLYLPAVVIVDDRFVPELAPLALEVAAEWDDEVCGLMFELAALDAEEDWTMN